MKVNQTRGEPLLQKRGNLSNYAFFEDYVTFVDN